MRGCLKVATVAFRGPSLSVVQAGHWQCCQYIGGTCSKPCDWQSCQDVAERNECEYSHVDNCGTSWMRKDMTELNCELSSIGTTLMEL